MRRTSTALLLTAVWATFFGFLAGGHLAAQAPSRPIAIGNNAPADNGQIEGVVRRGQKLESEQRWGEAVTLYEEALRENPHDRDLSTRHELAKIHYDLGRRYHDTSYLRSLTTLDQREAIALYGEVLSKIQSHYVSEPDWAAVVRRGTAGLEVALGEAAFTRQASVNLSRSEIDAFRQQLVSADAIPVDPAIASKRSTRWAWPSAWPASNCICRPPTSCWNMPAAPPAASTNTRPI